MPFNIYLASIKFKVRGIFLFIAVTTGLLGNAQNGVAPIVPNFPGVTFRWTGGFGWQPGNNENIPAPVINTLYPNVDAMAPLTNISAAGATPQVIHNSYGQGFNIGIRVGYMFNQYLGVDMGVTYQQSTTISAYQQTIFYQPDSANNPAPSGGYLDNTITTKSLSLVLTPAITLAYARPKFKFYPYLRAGLSLPVFTQVTHNLNMALDGVGANNTTYNSPYFIGDITTVTMQTNMLFTVGVTGAVGVVWRPYNFINFFAEVNGQYLNQKGRYTLITEWTADGTDLTPYRGAYRLEYNYVKSLNAQSNNALYNANYNVNLPKQDISPLFPFSNIGFNVGVQLVLNKKVFKDMDGFDQDRGKKIKVVKQPKKKKKKEEEVKPANAS
jgi:hypothetical protein